MTDPIVVLREDVRDRIVAILVQRLGGEVVLTAAEMMSLDDDLVMEVSKNWPLGEDIIRVTKRGYAIALIPEKVGR